MQNFKWPVRTEVLRNLQNKAHFWNQRAILGIYIRLDQGNLTFLERKSVHGGQPVCIPFGCKFTLLWEKASRCPRTLFLPCFLPSDN